MGSEMCIRDSPKAMPSAGASMLLGSIYLIQGKVARAEELTLDAYRNTQHLPDRSYIPLATSLNYSSVLLLAKKPEVATALLRDKIAAVEESWPAEHLYSGRFFALLAKAELDAGNTKVALAHKRKIQRADFSSRPDYEARAIVTLAELALYDDKLTPAELTETYDATIKAEQLIKENARIPTWALPEIQWLQTALQQKLGLAGASAVDRARRAYLGALPD